MNRTVKLLLAVAASMGLYAAPNATARAESLHGASSAARLPHYMKPTRSPGSRPDRGGLGCTGVLTYSGGPVISKIEAVAVYWGRGVGSTVQSWAPNYLKTIVNSPYIDQLSEYNTTVSGGTNQKITRGGYVGAYTITPTTATGSNVDDSQIGPELQAQIDAKVLPAPTYDKSGNPNSLYVLFFPPGVSITQGSASSCTGGGFCGYHMAFYSSSSKLVPYAVIPDMSAGSGCDSGCGPSSATELDLVATTVSHELAEAITDVDTIRTDSGLAWYDSTEPSQCQGEIGDLCADGGPDATSSSMSGTVSGITVQMLWSNKNHKCQLDDPSVPPQLASCASNADCSGSAPVCDTSSGSCVGCMSNHDCSGATPVCGASHTCGGCASNADCSGSTPACATGASDPNKGKCVACTASSECSGSTPVCGSDDACHGCTSDAQCTAPGKTHCDASGACVAAPTTGGGADAGTSGGGTDTGTTGGGTTGGGTGDDAGSVAPGGDAGGGASGDDAGGSGATAPTTSPHHHPTVPTAGGCAWSGASDASAFGLAFAAVAVVFAARLRRAPRA